MVTSQVKPWCPGDIVELQITDLTSEGEGVGRVDQWAVFVPDTIPGDRVLARLGQHRGSFGRARLHQVLEPSPGRHRPRCIVADKCGGCQWQTMAYPYQLQAKEKLVRDTLERVGGFPQVTLDPILRAPADLGYRNKVAYPLAVSASGQVQAGYYQKGSHQLVNLNQCPVQDPRLNPLLAEVKQDIQQRGWPIYQEQNHQGEMRHLVLRLGHYTGEILLTLVVRTGELPGLESQAQAWLERYPALVGVMVNYNPQPTNTILGKKTRCVAGEPWIRERFAGLELFLDAPSFFQVYTEQAEALLGIIATHLNLQGDEVLVDAYCGVGTLTLLLARLVKQAVGLEILPSAVAMARRNAQHNRIDNVTFTAGPVEDTLEQLALTPSVVLLDPPRKGCDQRVLSTLLRIRPQRLVYVSCNPATLARDLQRLSPRYHLVRVQPADFFPQTAHVECAAFLELQT